MKSKLGWQFQSVPGWADAVVNSEWVKVIDPPTEPRFQDRRTIGRVFINDNDTNAMVWRGVEGAREWYGRVAPTMTQRRWVHAWELPNEPQPVANYQFCLALAAFTQEAATLMRRDGFRSVGGNLSEGNPGGATETEEANLFCALASGLSCCDFWSQHAYWVPAGYPHKEAGYNQYHALRYQKNRAYAQARGIKLPPVLLTEGGYDYGIVGRPKQGWRSGARFEHVSVWPEYLADLKRFDADLMADPDVAGCQLFVSGGYSDWQSFEIGELESRDMAAYITSTGEVVSPPPPSTVVIGRPLPAGAGVISQVFGANVDLYQVYGFAGHEGLDYAAPIGTPVVACTAGRVLFAGTGAGSDAAYGLYVVVDHGKFRSWYCHMLASDVKAGDIVARGQRLGTVGNTGRSTGSHLHFAIQVEGARNGSKGFIDPWGLRILLGDA